MAALSKSIEFNNSGVFATYWILDPVTFNLYGGTVNVRIDGYKDSAAYLAGKGPLDNRKYTTLTPANFATITGTAMVTAIYTYIKTQAEFSGASDVA